VAKKYMAKPVTVDLVEGETEKASVDVTHLVLQVRRAVLFACLLVCGSTE
jgi:hypothetical protein